MRNTEHYPDPTAGLAMKPKAERLSQITGLKKERRVYNDLPEGKVPACQSFKREIKYYYKPAYVAK